METIACTVFEITGTTSSLILNFSQTTGIDGSLIQ
jgi:hypothetical protein